MATIRPKRAKPAKRKNELAKKDKAEDSEILATMTRNAKKVNIEKWHIKGDRNFTNLSIVGSSKLTKRTSGAFTKKFEAIKVALRSDSKSLQDEAIDTHKATSSKYYYIYQKFLTYYAFCISFSNSAVWI